MEQVVCHQLWLTRRQEIRGRDADNAPVSVKVKLMMKSDLRYVPARRFSLVALMLCGLLACTARPTGMKSSADATTDWEATDRSVQAGQWERAETALARLLQQDLRNGHLHFLHAFAIEQQALRSDRARLEHARVGFENALRFAPDHTGARLRLGFLELETGETAVAQEHFAAVVMDQPTLWEAWYGLGVASYQRRDLPMLALAAEQSWRLQPDNPDALRLLALARAVQGDRSADQLVRHAVQVEPDAMQARYLSRRVADVLAADGLESLDASMSAAPQPPGPDLTGTDTGAPPSQVMVDVTILLSSALNSSARGVNLFEGLRLLYGYSNTLSSRVLTGFGRENTRTVISQISTPQLDYSLDLFNDAGQHYSVVARPSITAYLGRESQFFAGRTLNVEVSGINLGQLLPIDVGVQLRVTPEAMTADRLTFTVSAERSFLSQEQIGTFERSLTTFRQSVGATAEVAFGQTLVMSALSEQVSDSVHSQVPGVGKVPVVNWFSRRSVDARRQESLLILVTPRLPLSFDTGESRESRARTVQQLLDNWQRLIDPTSDVEAILERVQHMRWLKAPRAGDLRTRPLRATTGVRDTVEESLLLGRR